MPRFFRGRAQLFKNAATITLQNAFEAPGSVFLLCYPLLDAMPLLVLTSVESSDLISDF